MVVNAHRAAEPRTVAAPSTQRGECTELGIALIPLGSMTAQGNQWFLGR